MRIAFIGHRPVDHGNLGVGGLEATPTRARGLADGQALIGLSDVEPPMRAVARSALWFVVCAGAAVTGAACGGHIAETTTEDARPAPSDAVADAADQGATEVCPTVDPERVRQTVQSRVPCFAGTLTYYDTCSRSEPGAMLIHQTSNASLDLSMNGPFRLKICNEFGDRLADAAFAAAGQAGDYVVKVSGGLSEQGAKLHAVLGEQCSGSWGHPTHAKFVIRIDSNGRVESVGGQPGAGTLGDAGDDGTVEPWACMERALAGLTFSCLAGAHLCPDPFSD